MAEASERLIKDHQSKYAQDSRILQQVGPADSSQKQPYVLKVHIQYCANVLGSESEENEEWCQKVFIPMSGNTVQQTEHSILCYFMWQISHQGQ